MVAVAVAVAVAAVAAVVVVVVVVVVAVVVVLLLLLVRRTHDKPNYGSLELPGQHREFVGNFTLRPIKP